MKKATKIAASAPGGITRRACRAMDDMSSPVAAALSAAGVGLAYLLPEDGTVVFNSVAQKLFGVEQIGSSASFLGRVGRSHRRPVLDFLTRHLRGSDSLRTESISFPLLLASGAELWVEITLSYPQYAEFEGGLMLILRDMTEHFTLVEQLRDERDHLRHTVELNPQLPWTTDANGKVLEFTERWLRLTGLSKEQALGEGWALAVHPDEREQVGQSIMNSVLSGQPFDTRCRIRTTAGIYRWMRARGFPLRNARGRIVRWYGYTEDIDDHVLAEQKIRWMAEHDALTRLPNRSVFNARLEQSLRDGYRVPERVALLLVDVDNFKDVNDILGHDAGDAMLVTFSKLLSDALPEGATLARIGGDEFAVLVPGEAAADVEALCERLFQSLRDPITINGRSIDCRFPIGGAVYPLHGQSPTELFKNADIALYEAKARGRGRFVLFSLEMKQMTQRRVAMINLGKEAVESASIVPFYQAQVGLSENRIIGFEALMRRRDRSGRIHPPSSIWAAFDDTRVAEAIGDAMLDAVLADMVKSRDMGIDLGQVAINVSTAEFRSNSFVDRITSRMAKANVPHERIVIEVTEGVFLGRQAENAVETIVELNRLGFDIALDDFGTGYASLSHLRQLPVNTLKIDRSFVSNVTQSKDDLAIVSAIISLGRSLGLEVIAEGIETEHQLTILRNLGLELGQGYLFSKPIPMTELYGFMTGWSGVSERTATAL